MSSLPAGMRASSPWPWCAATAWTIPRARRWRPGRRFWGSTIGPSAIARDILVQLPSGDAADILRRLRHTAQAVDATGVDNAHDLTGRIFQKLIADRKYLATFYTLPASAALLARLAVAKMEGVDWSDAEAIGRLRIGDFACGTGALLSTVYEQIAARHERAGGDAAALHKVMMEDVLYGCDVMPSAVHISGSTLSGLEPSVIFNDSHLYTMPYGRMQDGSVMIGSLELLEPNCSIDTKSCGTRGLSIWRRLAEVVAYPKSSCALDHPAVLRRLGVEFEYCQVVLAVPRSRRLRRPSGAPTGVCAPGHVADKGMPLPRNDGYGQVSSQRSPLLYHTC